LRAGLDVVEFNDIIGLEDQVSSVATALLTLEQLSDSGRDERGLPAPRGPIEPIAIIGTARSLHFGKAPDGRVRMICQLNPGILLDASRKDPLSVAEGLPVLAVHPSPVLLRMPSARPTLEVGEEGCRQRGEGAFTHLSGVVATPAANDRVEMSNQSGSGSRAMGSHDLGQLLAVVFNLVLSGFDECFEAERCASTATRLVFTD